MQESRWVGQSVRRKEDLRLLTGQGQYAGDVVLPFMLEAAFLRSPHAHARLRHIDVSAARALPGVVDVRVGSDFAHLGPVLSDLSVPSLPGIVRRPSFTPMPVDEVLYMGDLVAVVVAKSRYVAEDALERIRVEYEPLPAVLDPEAALSPTSPLVYPEWGDNLVYQQRLQQGDVDGAFAAAHTIVRERFRGHRCGATPMEPRVTLAHFTRADGLTVWLTTQRSHIKRHLLAEYFRIPDRRVRVIAPRDVGGGFGVKAPLYREDLVICHLAMSLDRPVRWIEHRQENLANIGQERDQVHDLELALTREGRILAVRDRMLTDCGDARVPIYVSFSMPWLGAMYLTNGYDIPNIDIDLKCVVTHKAGLTPSRAFGSFVPRFAIDRIVDIAAQRLGLDPLAIRDLNAIRKFPHDTATGVHCDSGDFPGALAKAREAIGYDAFRQAQATARQEGRYLGVGFSLGIEFSGLSSQILVPMERQPGFGVATIRMEADGSVQLATGDQPQGQGHDTTLSQVVADELGVTPDDIHVVTGDTQATPFAAGTLASRMGGYTLSAALLAARGLKPKMVAIAAHLLALTDTSVDAYEFVDHHVVFRADRTRRISIARVAETALLAPTELPPGMSGGLDCTAHFEAEVSGMQSTNVHAVTVEVFPETGIVRILRYVAVDDAGRAINPLLVRGQIHGGVALGISNAMQEEFVYDADGRQLNTSLQNYLIASAADLPPIDVIAHDIPSPHTPLGSKGKGEGPTGMAPGALGNAIQDALNPLGVTLTRMPFSREHLWRLAQGLPPT
ncbi:MAG: xanthine dehydrogenase family protein molybdopterin-binding subunit [Gammaproteobacteria bacterium]